MVHLAQFESFNFYPRLVIKGDDVKSADVFPMQDGIKNDTLSGSLNPTGGNFGMNIKMLDKVRGGVSQGGDFRFFAWF